MSSFNIKNIRKWMANDISCICKIEKLITILLHPIYSGKLEEGVKTELDSLVNKYSEQFDGLLLGYDSVKICGDTGMIFDTFPYIHIEIQAKFYIFHPKVGDIVEGVVVKKSPHHVGCLVHELFNISCFIPSNTNINKWCGSNAYEGDILKIKVTDRDMKSFVPYFKGSIEAISSSGNQNSQSNIHKYFKEEDLDSADLSSTNKLQKNCKKSEMFIEESSNLSLTDSSKSNKITFLANKLNKNKKNKFINVKIENETSSEETIVKNSGSESEQKTKKKKKKNKDVECFQNTISKKKKDKTSSSFNLPNEIIKIKKERSSNEDSDSYCLDQSSKNKVRSNCKKKIKVEL